MDDAAQSMALMNAVLENRAPDAARDIVLLNAAACLYAANVCGNLTDGVALAKEALQSGRAKAKQLQWLAMNPA